MASQLIYGLKNPNLVVSVKVRGLKEATDAIRKINKRVTTGAASILLPWRKMVLRRLGQRIMGRRGPGGGTWPNLKPSTMQIRSAPRELTRLKPKRGGGTPVRPLIGRKKQYLNAWSSMAFKVTHRAEKMVVGKKNQSFWQIGNKHIAVINEFWRTTSATSAIPNQRVPARSVAYIREDPELLDKLVKEFLKQVFDEI